MSAPRMLETSAYLAYRLPRPPCGKRVPRCEHATCETVGCTWASGVHTGVVTQQGYVMVLQRSIARLVTIICSLPARWTAHLGDSMISLVLISNTPLGFHEHRKLDMVTDSSPARCSGRCVERRSSKTGIVYSPITLKAQSTIMAILGPGQCVLKASKLSFEYYHRAFVQREPQESPVRRNNNVRCHNQICSSAPCSQTPSSGPVVSTLLRGEDHRPGGDW